MNSYILTAIVFVVIFSVLILVHEFGHFIMAKRAGIKVEEFGFGLPPMMFGKKIGETVYSINWIPFGGFVRMLGEDSKKASMLKNKRSFMAQSARNRLLVIIAGVVMNFFLAWVLLTVGFSFGMKPLLLPDEVFTVIDEGKIVLQEGLKIKNVEEGGFIDDVGLQNDDVITAFNEEALTDDVVAEMSESPRGTYDVFRNGRIYKYNAVGREVPADFEEKGLRAEFYDAVSFPRVGVFEVKETSPYYLAGLRTGDNILSVNNSQVYSVREFEELIRGKSELDIVVYRNGLTKAFSLALPQNKQVVVESVIQDMPGDEAGLQKQDIILSVNGEKFDKIEDLVTFTKQYKNKELTYVVNRGGEEITFGITTNGNGQIGVLLSELMTYSGDPGITLFNSDVYSSVVEVKDEKYPVHVALYKSVGEMWKLSKVTASMFVGVVVDVFSSGSVPDSVAGPVGIAGMTHVVVKEGFVSVLRFIALLSLSLAVINILPFPALDGGRLLFLVVEFVIGRRVNQRLESFLHGISYFLILLLILMVTYSDLLRLFVK